MISNIITWEWEVGDVAVVIVRIIGNILEHVVQLPSRIETRSR